MMLGEYRAALPTPYNNDPGSFGFSIGSLRSCPPTPVAQVDCPCCLGTGASGLGVTGPLRCGVCKLGTIHPTTGRTMIDADLAEDWRMDMADKGADQELALHDEDDT